MLKRLTVLLIVALLAVGFAGIAPAAAQETKLVMLTHWGEEVLLTAQQAMIAEFEAANPGIKIELQTVPFGDLLTKIVTGNTAGTNPDIYHLYNLWLPEFSASKLLAAPPAEIVDYVTANTTPNIQEAISIGGQIYGIPTEVNTYLLIYNKKLLSEAGYSAPPKTWDELKEMAAKITKKDSTGATTQVGFGVITGWDSGVVHPFTSMLYSNGGDYLTKDMTATAFNSKQGQETLQLYVDMIQSGGIDLSVPWGDFANGKIGMIVMANWWRATLMSSTAFDYKNDIGVAAIPVGPSGKDTSTLSYNWLLGVDAKSKNQEAAWKFVRWMGTARAEGKGSPIGEYLVKSLGAIPSLGFDQTAFEADLSDPFLKTYVDSTKYARPEPIVAGGQEVKTKLQVEIEGVWAGTGDVATALQVAAEEGDAVLKEKAGK
jgi:multiple sugar transport system substrate-binding protein